MALLGVGSCPICHLCCVSLRRYSAGNCTRYAKLRCLCLLGVRVVSALPSLLSVRVLVVGDLMLDRYWYGDAERVSQEAPVPVVDVARTELFPGGAANTALNVVSLGAACTIVGAIGNDERGRALQERLEAAGVDCELVRVDGWETIEKLRVVSQQQQLLRADFESPLPAVDAHGVEVQELLQERFAKALPGCGAVVLQDYDKGVLAEPARWITAARAAGVPVVVDPKFKPLLAYAGADLVKPNVHEFRRAVGDWQDEAHLQQRAQELVAQAQWQALIVTRGGQGMLVVDATGERSDIPARAVDVFDVTGAGDTAAATLAICRALDWSPRDCAQLATLASGIAVTRSGTAAVTGPELAFAVSGAASSAAGVVSAEQLADVVDHARRGGARIVFTNGCFDILHAGHVAYLEEAAALGDRLIVAINDDASVAALNGPGRPVNPLLRRAQVLAGLASVDWVVGFAEDTPEALLEQLRPDVLVKGGDYSEGEVVGAEIVQGYGGQVAVLSLVDDCSTTAIVERIQSQ